MLFHFSPSLVPTLLPFVNHMIQSNPFVPDSVPPTDCPAFSSSSFSLKSQVLNVEVVPNSDLTVPEAEAVRVFVEFETTEMAQTGMHML